MAKTDPSTSNEPVEKPELDDKGVFTGNPEENNEPEAKKGKSKPNSDRVKVTIGDQELETDAASAAVINSMLQMNQEMAALIRNGYSQPAKQPAAAPKAPEFDYDTELFTNPKGAIERLRSEIKAEVKAEMTGQYNAAESSKAFWNEFYSTNADLKGEKLIVDAILQRDWAKLKDMDAPKAAKYLAESTKKEIMRLSGGKSESDPDFRPSEGGSNKAPATKKNSGSDDENTPKSLSDIIRARQEQRRNAQYRKTKE